MGGDSALHSERRLPDEAVLAIVAERLTRQFGGDWTVEPGRLKGPGTLAVQVGADHTGFARHVDLDFVLNMDRPHDTTVPDCTGGYGATVEDAVRQAVDSWMSTTACTVLELIDQRGRYATHRPADDPDGFPGWHSIHGAVVGWGSPDGDPGVVVDWIAANPLAPYLAPLIADAFDRDHLIGVKVLLGGARGNETAEVRVNGRRHDAASDALLRLGFPRGEHLAFARCFMLLVHNERSGGETP